MKTAEQLAGLIMEADLPKRLTEENAKLRAELADAKDHAATMHAAKDIALGQVKDAAWHARAECAFILFEEIKRRKAAVAALSAFVHYEPWMDGHGDDMQVSTFKRHTFGDLRKAASVINGADEDMEDWLKRRAAAKGMTIDELREHDLTAVARANEKTFTCAGRRQVLPEPGDCDWPLCGCDPYAQKVLDALLENGMWIARKARL